MASRAMPVRSRCRNVQYLLPRNVTAAATSVETAFAVKVGWCCAIIRLKTPSVTRNPTVPTTPNLANSWIRRWNRWYHLLTRLTWPPSFPVSPQDTPR